MIRAHAVVLNPLFQRLFNGSPSGVPPKTDCTIRKAAWDYAKKLQPQKKGFKQVYNALQLQNCGVSVKRAPLLAVMCCTVVSPPSGISPPPSPITSYIWKERGKLPQECQCTV